MAKQSTNIRRLVRDWALALSMMAGASAYFLGRSLPLPEEAKRAVVEGVGYVQPTLIFLMLLLTFCRIRLEDMRLRVWQWWLLAFQAGMGALLCWLHQVASGEEVRLLLQSAMLCFLCPTATAAVVVTAKLGGNPGSLTAYTILVNLLAAVLFPTFIPIVNPTGGLGFLMSFWMIVQKVFPLLICPLLLAVALRRVWPRLTGFLARQSDLPFNLWIVSLSLAIAVTTRIIVHAEVATTAFLAIAAGSLAACVAQFALGRLVGSRYADGISGAQACGQKNTILAIWVGYTFLNPLTSLAGGFYSIWHNAYNSWQLYRHGRPS